MRPFWFLHPAGARRPLDRLLNHGPLPGGGESDTIAQAGVYLGDPTASPSFTPGLHLVIDVGNWQDSRWSLPGGQRSRSAITIAVIAWSQVNSRAAGRETIQAPCP